MRDLNVCLNCDKLWKRHECKIKDNEVVARKLCGYKCLIYDKKIIKSKAYFQKKSYPDECKYKMEHMIICHEE